MAAITNEIYIGSKDDPDYYFINDDIYSINGSIACNLVAEELSIDTLEISIDYENVKRRLFKPTDYDGFMSSDNYILCGHYTADIRELPFGTPLWYYNGEKYVGKFYVDNVTRTSKTQYTIKAVSIIGILDKQTFYGGMYSGKTFSALIRDIFLSNGMQTKQGVEYLEMDRACYSCNISGEKFNSRSSISIDFYYEGVDSSAISTTEVVDGLFGYKFVIPTVEGITLTGGDFYLYSKMTRDSTDVDFDGSADIYLCYGSQSDIGPITIQPDTDIHIEINGATGKFSINDVSVDFTPEEFDYKETITLESITFTVNSTIYCSALCYNYKQYTSNTSYTLKYDITRFKAKFYSLTVETSEETVRKFIPFYYIGESSPLLCDIVNNDSSSRAGKSTGGSIAFGPDKMYEYPSFVNYSDEEYEMYQSIEYDEGIKDYAIYGWIPICTKREALYQVMFAYNINLVKSEDDTILLTWLYDSDPVSIPDSRVYNNGSIEYNDPAKLIEITEHSFTDDTTEDSLILYDNTEGLATSDVTVTFNDAPIVESSIVATGSLSIEAKNANCAVVSGVGALKGRKYQHNTNVISKSNYDADAGQSISVTDAYLVTLDNSENVMKRLYAYYTKRRTIKNSIVLSEESTGRNYSFTDPFEEQSSGWLRSMSISASAILKADCEFITNYTPTGNGSNFTKAVVLTGSGTFVVPAEVFLKTVRSIRIVLVGGGQGGQSGLKGEDGRTGGFHSSAPQGGAGGEAGSGGKIYSYTIEEPMPSYEYSCGEGGAGGAICYSTETHNEGAEGSDTTFGEFTSADGAVIDSGVHNFFTGKVYGNKQAYSTAYSGCNGGYDDGSYWYYPGSTYYIGYYDPDGTYHSVKANGGSGQSEKSAYLTGYNSSYSWWGTFYGGNGGGATTGSNGGDGGYPSKYNDNTIRNGNGGNGANAIIKGDNAMASPYHKECYGTGGFGGYGGGAGGDSGWCNLSYGAEQISGTPGTGGYGGEGGDGAPGCIIVYY